MRMLPPDFVNQLSASIAGELRTDSVTRLLYSTDASIYQIEPLGVLFPKSAEDVTATMELAYQFNIPILARGSGSSIAGQAVNTALVIDFSRYLNRIVEINREELTATVEPGVIVNTLNRQASKLGMMFGPDPASAERATIGGSIANNATGAHSIIYGMAADHVLSADVVLSDGSTTIFQSLSIEEATKKTRSSNTIESSIYSFILDIHHNHANYIREHWPRIWRRAAGYNLNYILPWSATRPPQWDVQGKFPYPPIELGTINFAPIMAGSEGTLAIMKSSKLRMVPKPKNTVLGILNYQSIADACDAIPSLLELNPSAIELIPAEIILLARSIPAYAKMLTFVRGEPKDMLVVEFSGNEPEVLLEQVKKIGSKGLIAESLTQQKQVWDVRKVGLGIINSIAGDAKPYAFIEDTSVPVELLGNFVREMEKIMAEYGVKANYYAHASAGCLHIRPILPIKTKEQVARMRSIAERVVDLVSSLGGAVSGEHGLGLARSEWIERSMDPQIRRLFKELKLAADPNNLLNPGKIVNPLPMDANLRYGDGYKTTTWPTQLDFSRQAGLSGAIEMCNGAGVCRKDFGLMCPSFQATNEEMHSPRGRSNLLRAMISGHFPIDTVPEEVIYAAFDLCLACKGCKSECPSGVDVAKLKLEFLYKYYQTHPHRIRDYIFCHIGTLASLSTPFAPILNPLLENRAVRIFNEKFLGLAAERTFPKFATIAEKKAAKQNPTPNAFDVLFLNDSFSENFHPETAIAGTRCLQRAGLKVRLIPVIGAGKPQFSKGFLDKAREHASRLIDTIKKLDPAGLIPVVGVEPSEILTLRDEYLDLFPGDAYIAALAKRTWMIDEYLIRPGKNGDPLIEMITKSKISANRKQSVLLHGQCIQKVQPPADDGYPTGAQATIAMLQAAGYSVSLIESGCCGMAGSFGYETEHYELSMKIGNTSVFPAINKANSDTIIAASGTSCRSQIKNGTERIAVHPITLI